MVVDRRRYRLPLSVVEMRDALIMRLLDRARWFALRGAMRLVFLVAFPVAAWIGGRTARKIATLIGLAAFYLDVDWRTVSLRHHFLRERTFAAMQEIVPGASSKLLSSLVRERFVYAAHEELDAHYFFSDASLVRSCEFVGLDAVREVSSRMGIVYLTLHLDATLMGVAQLGKAGLKLNLMTSNIVEDVRVPAVLRRFFRRKYEGIERHLNGGHYWHIETSMRDFYRALARGEGAVILCEAPALSSEDGFLTEFLGKTRALTRGSLRLAEKTGAALVGMVCLRTGPECYRIVFSPVFEPSVLDPESAVREVYAFLGNAVYSSPGRWWAADLLPSFINIENGL